MYNENTTADILRRSLIGKNDGIREYAQAGIMNAESTECLMCPEIILRSSGKVCPACSKLFQDLIDADDTEIYEHNEDCSGCDFSCRPLRNEKRNIAAQSWYKALEWEHSIAMGSGNVSMVGMTFESDGEEVDCKVLHDVAVPVDYKGDGSNYDAWIFVKNQIILAKAQNYLMGANQLVKLLEAEGLDTPESTVRNWIVDLKTESTTVDDKNVKIPANIVSFIKKNADVFVNRDEKGEIIPHSDIETEILREIKKSVLSTLVYIFNKTGKMPKETASRRVKESVSKEARTPRAKKAPKPVARVGFGGTRTKVCGCGSTACDRSSKGCNSKGVRYEPVVESRFPVEVEEDLFMEMAA